MIVIEFREDLKNNQITSKSTTNTNFFIFKVLLDISKMTE